MMNSVQKNQIRRLKRNRGSITFLPNLGRILSDAIDKILDCNYFAPKRSQVYDSINNKEK